jgi:hypothetical protein
LARSGLGLPNETWKYMRTVLRCQDVARGG